MNFELDKQTIKDLEIFGNDKAPHSIFSFYNYTITIGGRKCLYDLMRFPTNDLDSIEQRRDTIKFIHDVEFELKINSSQFEFIDHYLNLNIDPLRNNFLDAYAGAFSYYIKQDNNYYIIQSGIKQLISLFRHLNKIITPLIKDTLPAELQAQIQQISALIKCQDMKEIFTPKEKISCIQLNRLDSLFRKKYKAELLNIIRIVYFLDACISVARAAREKKLSYPEYLTSSIPSVVIEGLYHPLLENAVPYDVNADIEKNLCFLTGPNMAGKSTFMKALGLSVYLAHLGFPVPASRMRTTVFNGVISTINLSDDRNLGYSHFYSEVKRVKQTALKIREQGNFLIIFDELFRGTNVKDAFDASLIIIRSFAKIAGCKFFISTHITEIAEELKDMDWIQFRYFDSHLENDRPIYNYQLLSGVSHERLGMQIIKNENIMDILNSITDKENQLPGESCQPADYFPGMNESA